MTSAELLTATRTARFDTLLDLEQEVRITAAVALFQGTGTPDRVHARNASNEASAKARLFAAVAELTPAEAAAFGEYRLAVRAGA